MIISARAIGLDASGCCSTKMTCRDALNAETPEIGTDWDRQNLETLRKLSAGRFH